MRGEPVELACPFCDKGKIQCWYIPASFSVKQSRSRVIHGNKIVKSADIWLIKSGCSVCDKSAEEVEKKLKEEGVI